MPIQHTVAPGEDLFVIARRFGFRDHRTIYDDPANAELRRQRPNPGILHPGDLLVIPDRQPRVEEGATDRRHSFRTIGARRWLRLRLLGPFGKPLADRAYTLEVDGRVLSEERRTDEDGQLSEAIPLDATTGKVTVGDLFWHLDIGDLNPLFDAPDGGVSGAQARLRNLGFDPGPIDGLLGPRTAGALRRFQDDQGMAVTGRLDDATKSALLRAHGC